ncbi:MAG: amidohydrolase family protein [Bacteroidales bacterium]|nr:amidohydrolase family protein [Bacteroidales bacterium]
MNKKTFIVIILIMISSFAISQIQTEPFSKYLILKNVTLIDCKDTISANNKTIIIKDGLIKDIINSNSNNQLPEGKIIDLVGHFVIPGLIEGHIHISGVTDEVLQKSLRYGITGIRDMAGHAMFLKEIKTRIDKNELQAPDIYYSALFAGEDFIQNDFRARIATPESMPLGTAPWIRQIDAQTDIPKAIKDAIDCGATGIKLYAHLSADLVNKITKEAHKQGLKVWAHAFVYPAKPEDLVAANVNGMSHAPLLLYATDSEYMPQGSFDLRDEVLNSERMDNILDGMKRNNIFLDPTLFLFKVTINELSNKKPELKEKLELAYKITRKAYRKGVKFSLGTDFTLINEVTNKPTIFDEIYLMVNDIGMSPIEAISACTKNNAELLGIEKTHGTIEVGKRANLIVLWSNPIDDIRNIEDQAIIIKNGIIVHQELEKLDSK